MFTLSNACVCHSHNETTWGELHLTFVYFTLQIYLFCHIRKSQGFYYIYFVVKLLYVLINISSIIVFSFFNTLMFFGLI